MADYGTLRVSTDELMTAAELAFQAIETCRSSLEKVSSTIAATDAYWRGDAGEAAREFFTAHAKASIDGLEELATYPQDLLQYHGLYSEVIATTQRQVQEIDEYSLG